MRLLALTLSLAAVAALLIAGLGGEAGADSTATEYTTVLDDRLEVANGTVSEACHTAYRPGAPGVATRSVDAAKGLGQLRASLAGSDSSDFDIAVFDADQAAVASAELGSTESSTGFTEKGGTLRVQVCRVSGDADGVPVTVERAGVPGDADALRADPPQLVKVSTPTEADKQNLTALGLDLSEHGGGKSIGVVLHGDADREKLRRAGLEWTVLVKDLVKDAYLDRRAEARGAARAGAPLPSGRTETYRQLADYNAELKKLADENPSLVRTIVLPNKTLLGKDVMGIEITKDVNAKDGKPGFFNMGVHHSREWPAGEMPMEWAYELITKYKAGDARAKNVVENSRNTIVPIINPDGFNASRTAGQTAGVGGGRNPAVPDTAYILAGTGTGGEYRRKNCRLPDDSDAADCLTSAGLAETGVDPNRNYGQFWGGPGASTDVTTQTYRGKAPFSEPESRNVREYVAQHHIMSLITNHTTAALVLRAPGLASIGDPIDEDKGYKALGDDMAKQNGYFSQKSFELYDTTGTTEDWTYNATGGFGFTIEIYCGDPNYETGDCDAPAFHPTYSLGVIDEWNGDSATANHVNDPGPLKNFDGQGMREAYYVAAESAINKDRHSVLEGTAPAGATLRLAKSFKTQTFPQADGKPIEFDDKLDTVMDVPASGKFEWNINPSTRPVVAKDTGKMNPGPVSPNLTGAGGTSGPMPMPAGDDGAMVPTAPLGEVVSSQNYNDHPFTIPAGGDNAALDISVKWMDANTDWDIELYKDLNGNGTVQSSDPLVDSSGTSEPEEIVNLFNAADLAAGTKYVLRVINYSATENYTITGTYQPFPPFKAGQVESWTLTCEVGGKVLQTSQVTIKRGEKQTPDLSPCIKAAPVTPTGTVTPGATGTPSPTTGPTATPTPGGGGSTSEKIKIRFTGLRLKPNKARRIRFRISCPAGAPATCKGRFRLVTTLKGKTQFVASRRFAVKAGKTKVVSPIVRKRVYKALTRGKKVKLRIRLTGKAGKLGLQVVSKNFAALKRPR